MPLEQDGIEEPGGTSGLLHYLVGLCGTCLPSVMTTVKKKSSGKDEKDGPKRLRRETWHSMAAVEPHSSTTMQANRTRTRSNADYSRNVNKGTSSMEVSVPVEEDVPMESEVSFPFQELPQECQLKIFSFLTPMERGVAAQVCHDWHGLVRVPSLWSMVDLTAFPLCTKVKAQHKCGPKCYDSYKKRLKSFIHFLEAVEPALHCFRFSLDIGDSKDKWLSCVQGLLNRSYCDGLEVAQLDWKETPVKPFFMDDYSHLAPQDHAYAHRRRQRFFISFFEFFINLAPSLKKLILPFDWSKPSLDLIARLDQTLHTLVIEKYYVFRQLPQESINKLINSLPHLRSLILEVWTPSGKDLLQYHIGSPVLQHLDISQSRGFYLRSLDAPELKIFKVARHPWNGPLTRIDDVKISCVYDVLREGAPNLQQLNEHTLRPGWHDSTYQELDTVLRAVCSCRSHKAGWAM